MKGYYELTSRGRALRLRKMAQVALNKYDLDIRQIRLITNDMNGIFRIDTIGREKFILRVCLPGGGHSLDEIRSEMMWLAALRNDTDLGVPKPLKTCQGDLVTTVELEGIPEPRHCVIFSWVPGPDLAENQTPDNYFSLGAFTAQLHNQAESFKPPVEFRVRTIDRVYYYSNPEFDFIEPKVLYEDQFKHYFSNDAMDVFRNATDIVQAKIDELYKNDGNLRVIHNDLHQWNVKVYRGRIFVLDFEDLMWGYPIQDIATSLFYFRWDERFAEIFEAYYKGYTSINEWPETSPGQLETLIIGRALMLMNFVVQSSEPEDQTYAPGYINRIQERTKAFLDSVQF